MDRRVTGGPVPRTSSSGVSSTWSSHPPPLKSFEWTEPERRLVMRCPTMDEEGGHRLMTLLRHSGLDEAEQMRNRMLEAGKTQRSEFKKQSSSWAPVNSFEGDKHDKDNPYYRYNISSLTPNLDFYQNREPFKPKGVYIEDLLTNWKYDYGKLESNHSYIQWLFPLRAQGRNPEAKPLTMDEIQIMKRDNEVMKRFLAAYRLMLGFYGIELQNSETGEVKRAKNWKEGFENLNYHSHNNLRITRILKCLGEMGYDHFQAPLVRFFLQETLCNNQLPNVKRSAVHHFISTVKDKQQHWKLELFIRENKSQEPWEPGKKPRSYRNVNNTGSATWKGGVSTSRMRKFSRPLR